MDRVENGLKTADSLLARLTGSKKTTKEIYSVELLSRLAERIYLLEAAYETVINELPREAFIKVEAKQTVRTENDFTQDFFGKICQMYQLWAKRRRMHLQVLGKKTDQDSSLFIASVSGFGSYLILQKESGFHVWEKPKADQSSFQRSRITVTVIPQPTKPAANLAVLQEQAEKGFKSSITTDMKIIRRYRQEPSPLVRDQNNNWRTGRIDQVLDGDFDLFS